MLDRSCAVQHYVSGKKILIISLQNSILGGCTGPILPNASVVKPWMNPPAHAWCSKREQVRKASALSFVFRLCVASFSLRQFPKCDRFLPATTTISSQEPGDPHVWNYCIVHYLIHAPLGYVLPASPCNGGRDYTLLTSFRALLRLRYCVRVICACLWRYVAPAVFVPHANRIARPEKKQTNITTQDKRPQ